MSQFGSLITAMITPFKGRDSADFIEGDSPIDYDATEKLVKHLIETGSDALVISGTTGESPTLGHDEEYELFKFIESTANSIDPKVKIIFGTGSNCTKTVIASNKDAEELGADGLLIVTPYYNKPNQKGLKRHFNRIAKETSLPIILYNIPGRSVINMNAETIIDVVNENSNIIGLKEASNNMDQVSAISRELDSNKFTIYSGDDSLTLPMMAVGAQGVVSVASHLVGKDMKKMLELFSSGNIDKAREIHNRLFPLFVELFKEPNPTCVKEALSVLGICSPVLREPLVELEENQKKSLKAVMDQVLLSSVA